MLTDRIFCSAVIFLQCSTCVLSLHSTALDDAALQTSNASPAKKYRKKLRKEEGAIRLVGGSNDYEGKWLLRLTYTHFFVVVHIYLFASSFTFFFGIIRSHCRIKPQINCEKQIETFCGNHSFDLSQRNTRERQNGEFCDFIVIMTYWLQFSKVLNHMVPAFSGFRKSSSIQKNTWRRNEPLVTDKRIFPYSLLLFL